MSNQKKWMIGVGLFIALMCIAVLVYQGLSQSYEKREGQNKTNNSGGPSDVEQVRVKAPDFTVYDGNGKEVKLSDFKGKPVVVNLWASWCDPCKDEMPHFDKAHAQFKEEVVFMMVDLVDGQRETIESGQAFIEEGGYSFPVYFDTDHSAAYAYSAVSIPATFFIDKDGYIVYSARGAFNEKKLTESLELIR